MSKRQIAVVTGTRAEYGLLKRLLFKLQIHPQFELKLLVTGSHLSKKYGLTVNEIEQDGLPIASRVNLGLETDTPGSVSKATARAITGFSEVFDNNRPDLVVVLGDRYELIGAAIAAMIHRIPIAHIHGGEVTEGAMDEGIRHSLTKMSHLHFVATEEYRRRVVQLGENVDFVFNVGGLGVDAIKSTSLISKKDIEAELGFSFRQQNILITFHPVTLEPNTAARQIDELLNALSYLKDVGMIFTLPNADTENQVLFDKIADFVRLNERACSFPSLGQRRYYSCVALVDAVVGNSSSGLLEVPTFKKATVNIGDRQRGRIKAASVLDCEPVTSEIVDTISHSLSDEFRNTLANTTNPYGEGGAAKEIVGVLEKADFGTLLKKQFIDI